MLLTCPTVQHRTSPCLTQLPVSRPRVGQGLSTGLKAQCSHKLCLAVLTTFAAAGGRGFGRCRRGHVRLRAGPADGRVLVVGGSGRVGGSTARWIQKLATEEGLPKIHLAVGGRNRSNYTDFVSRWVQNSDNGAPPDFIQVDLSSRESVRSALSQDWSLLVHTAGPFQGIDQPVLLEEAVRAGVPYVDVCDDTELCKVAKGMSEDAEAAKVPAVVSAGIWPGVSALMVAEAVQQLGGSADQVELSFYTAGTGGAGPTIVSATFLLLAEPPLVYKSGQACRAEPWDERRLADFGPGVGLQYVHLLDEPEVYTCHRALSVPNISSSFGTAPDVWNLLFAAVKLLPASVLRNRPLMQAVANFSMPIISAVDQLVGSTNAMRVDAVSPEGERVTLRITHSDLEDCVGLATAAFGLEVLQGRVPSGVWFPVEMASNRSSIFERVRKGSILWEL
eukprot:TRINITY_DN61882_c0_g1_i1.p1 TRINITY_DN61882_c0_g1~~TRINITY_DN61882_c0_g1_i1.p1  ORF type:complete len:448 (-),score=60.01 TRINITY_DN61882_c0_g1_i1:58-1401(-)